MSSLWAWYADHNHHRHFARVFSKASRCIATAVDVCPRGRAINPLELLSGGSSPSSSASASSASTSSASALASTSASVSQPSSSTSAAGTSMKSTWYSSQNQDFAKIFGLSHVFDFEFRQFHKWYFFLFCFVPLAPSHPYDPTTFVELLPMLSAPSLYGRETGQFHIASSSPTCSTLCTKYEQT